VAERIHLKVDHALAQGETRYADLEQTMHPAARSWRGVVGCKARGGNRVEVNEPPANTRRPIDENKRPAPRSRPSAMMIRRAGGVRRTLSDTRRVALSFSDAGPAR